MATKPTPKPKLKRGTGRYPGPGYDEAAEAKRVEKFMKTQESRKYSPAPMSAAAKAAAGAAGKAAKKASDARMAAKNAGKFSKAITPPAKKAMTSGGKAFTPAQLAELRKMLKNK